MSDTALDKHHLVNLHSFVCDKIFFYHHSIKVLSAIKIISQLQRLSVSTGNWVICHCFRVFDLLFLFCVS